MEMKAHVKKMISRFRESNQLADRKSQRSVRIAQRKAKKSGTYQRVTGTSRIVKPGAGYSN